MNIEISNRNFGLDVIRSLAIFLVILSHCTYLLELDPTNLLVLFVRSLGAVGVDLFFVLSGFLIGGILLKQINRQQTKYKHLFLFWKRRWLRTLPNYYLVLVLNIVLVLITNQFLTEEFLLYFFFLQNFTFPHPDFFTEAWSLSIEEYAYLVLPLLMFLLINSVVKNGKKTFLLSTLTIIGLLFILKLEYYFESDVASYQDWTTSFRKVVIYRMDSIYFGFLLVYLIREFHAFFRKHRYTFLILSFLIFFGLHLSIYVYNLMPENSLGFYVFVYLTAIIISCASAFPFFIELCRPRFNFLRNVFYYLSTRSYSIYLVNYSLILLTIQKSSFSGKGWTSDIFILLLYLMITGLFSELLYSYFEKPILNYRNKKYVIH